MPQSLRHRLREGGPQRLDGRRRGGGSGRLADPGLKLHRVTEVTLRVAKSDDLPAVLKFWQVAAENESRPPDTPTAIEALHRRDADALILAVDGDEIVGTVIAGWD